MNKTYNYDSVIVTMADIHVFDYVYNGETEKEALNRVEKYYQDNLGQLLALCERNPDDEYWQKRVSEVLTVLEKGYKVVSYTEFRQIEREHLLSEELETISRDAYDNVLDELPPVGFLRHGRLEFFCFAEFLAGTITNQYARDLVTGTCYRKLVDIQDRSTWIPSMLANS